MKPLRTGLMLGLCLLPAVAVAQNDVPKPAAVDRHGDPLPAHVRARLGTIRFRHGSPVAGVRYSADGKTIFSAGNDQSLRVWDAANGKELFTVGGTEMQASRFNGGSWIVSPDGKYLATFDGIQQMKLLDIATGKELRKFGDAQNRGNGGGMAFSPDGKLFASLGNDPAMGHSLIHLWEVDTGKEVRKLEGPEPKNGEQRFNPNNIVFSPNGKFIAASGYGGRGELVRAWEVETGKALPQLVNPGNKATVADILDSIFDTNNPGMDMFSAVGTPLFSPDSKTLVGIIQNNRRGGVKLRAWDPITGKHIRDLGDHPNGINNVVFAPDSKRIAVMRGDQNVQMIDVNTGKDLTAISITNGGVVGLVFSPNGKIAAIGSNDQTLKLHDVDSGKELHELKGYSGNYAQVNIYQMGQGLGSPIAFSPDGKRVTAAGGSLVRSWDLASGKALNETEGHEGNIYGIAASPDGKLLATISDDNTVRLWDLATQKELRQMELPKPGGEEVNGFFNGNNGSAGGFNLVFAPDGKTLAGGWADGSILLWKVEDGKLLHRAKVHDYGICSLAFSANGKNLASGGTDGRVLWWDTTSGKQIRQFSGPPIGGAEADPNIGLILDVLPGNGAMSVAIAPDGRTLAAAGMTAGTYEIHIWEITSGKLRRKFAIHNPGMNNGIFEGDFRFGNGIFVQGGNGGFGLSCLVFAPDGKTLAWASGSTVRLWDAVRGKELRQFGGQDGSIAQATFSPDGKHLIAANTDGTLRVWDVQSGTILNHVPGHRGAVSALVYIGGKTLASAGADTSVLLWDIDAAIAEEVQPVAPSAKVLGELWKQLSDDDASKAGDSVARLAAAPKEALPLLRERVKAEPAIDPAKLEKLVADLSDNGFVVRKKATDELERLGELAEPTLRKALEGNPPLESKMRMEQLLQKLNGPVTHPERLRALRALEVLEQIGTPEAREVLKTVADGAPGSHLTQDAKAALDRLGKQSK